MSKIYPYEQQRLKELGRFQRKDWEIRSELDGLKPVLNPSGGLENYYTDELHKVALSKNVDFHRAKRVLDFGCGIGRITHRLAEKVEYVIGIDIMLGMLEKAMNRIKHKNVCFAMYDGQRFPIRSNSIDLVTSVYVLQHIINEKDLRNIIDEMKRVLTDNGKVCFIEQVSKSPTTYGMPDDFVRQRLPEEYRTYFGDYGFILKKWEIVSVEEKGKWENRILGGMKKLPVLQNGMNLFAHFQFLLNRKKKLDSSMHYDCVFQFEKKIL